MGYSAWLKVDQQKQMFTSHRPYLNIDNPPTAQKSPFLSNNLQHLCNR